MASILVLTQKAEVKSAKLSVDKNVSLDHIQKYYKKKTEPELLGTYNYKSTTLYLFGYTKGKAGTENKHELPPPHDSTLVFGDIVLVASKDENSFANPVNFKIEDYEMFYSKAFGGFDDLDEDDEDDDVLIEEEVEEEVEEEGIIEEEEDIVTYASEGEVEEEEEVIVKKEKRKTKATNVTISTFIHPDKQLKESSDKNDIRNIITQNIVKLLNFKEKEANDFEKHIYIASLKEADMKHIVKDWSNKYFVTLYKSSARKYIGNLCASSYIKNNELFNKYKNKEVNFKDICGMNYYELYSSKWKEAIDHQKDIEKRQLEGNKAMATDQFLCTRCFKRECTYYEMQTRSADEPMTIFINCLNCGKNWRQ